MKNTIKFRNPIPPNNNSSHAFTQQCLVLRARASLARHTIQSRPLQTEYMQLPAPRRREVSASGQFDGPAAQTASRCFVNLLQSATCPRTETCTETATLYQPADTATQCTCPRTRHVHLQTRVLINTRHITD
jgi:hypothetical protein